MKINTGENCFGYPSRVSFGGLVRSDQGKWIEGFYGVLVASTPLEAEPWRLRQALRLARDNGWTCIIIENDCQEAINLMNGDDDEENHPCRTLIEDCMNIRRELEPTIQHVLQEANRCANKMAKIGSTQSEKLVKILVPPIELVYDLLMDVEGITFPRGF